MRFFNVELQWYRNGRWQESTREVFVLPGETPLHYDEFSDKDRNVAAEKAIAELRQTSNKITDISVISICETRTSASNENYEIKVTNINGRWHARLFADGVIIDEMACYLQEDIGWICREMLNWRGRLGSTDARVESARRRHDELPVGGVIYCNALDEEKIEHIMRRVRI